MNINTEHDVFSKDCHIFTRIKEIQKNKFEYLTQIKQSQCGQPKAKFNTDCQLKMKIRHDIIYYCCG